LITLLNTKIKKWICLTKKLVGSLIVAMQLFTNGGTYQLFTNGGTYQLFTNGGTYYIVCL